nr:Gag-Pol polyprotein [Tanacetum cinerariifolium]
MMKGSDIRIQEKKAKLFNEWERNKHFPEKIASNLKFLNNLQPEWSQHKYNQKEVDELKDERIAKTQDPLALMANSNNPYVFLAPHQDQSSFNQNYLQQPMPNPEDITDPTTAMNMSLALMDKAFMLNYSTPTNNNQRISSNPKNRQIAQPGNRNQNQIGNGNLVVARAEGNAAGQNGNQIRCYNCRGVGIQLQAEEYDLMAVAADLDKIKEVNANCILMANLKQASTSEEPHTELLKPIPESHQVPQNDNDVISKDTSVEQGDTNREVSMNETFHVQTDDELTEKELKQIEADDQAIQTILLGLPEDIYAAVDSCETAHEIWLRVQQMMKGSDIGI